jgi:hypothetical protein
LEVGGLFEFELERVERSEGERVREMLEVVQG